MVLVPFQKPHPPIWYGVHAPESARRAAKKRLMVVSLDPVPGTVASFDAFRESWREAWGNEALPLMGLGRFVVVADTDAEALATARRAYPRWHRSFTHLHRLHNRPSAHPRPPDFDGLAAVGQGIAGSPPTVSAFLRRQVNETGTNYIVGQFAFGDLSLAETLRSIELFAKHVMPELQESVAAQAV
jgi:alkanesulfonate monooxygenase SsuD/methylene tetrahydromethanopterin reductase-like flavin-dependent oxidoreductase (luciferase family)